ncbi:MAG TPA: acetyl/propionyl/methylcrotonyl-CoA carboxylase subunit alpha [Rhodospirillales bacterium]|nr:acetyl/propionyl/methylcrotonyl-CoA carboxylase subunit alpha [Rhodospirillales bacterium]
MFKKILIANRGEIACRIARTAKRMGLTTVAVYSDADKYGRHVGMCDESVYLGGSLASESYLQMEKIVNACRRMGVDCVHPGYGFLSENTNFAQALANAGIAFVGPNSDVIRLMGDKIMANRAAKEAGVPTVPGHWDAIPTPDDAVEIAKGIGFPVMLKAAAGGGGKGIRIAHDEAEVRDAFRLATSEARSAFGDERVFIEKFIVDPRHIEIQILADKHGNVFHLNERECSIQRRHQKVIEEAPSPFLDAATRREMGERAVALARSAGYDSAGTVEFIADQRRNFYFLEMNTRLQVEHSVTEFTHNIDLVEWMIRIANNEKLPLNQAQIQPHGWAIESRIYAEDPNRKFMPSTGRLVRYREPEESQDVRVDSGVYEGGEISMFYDPMIAKVTTWGRDRDAAIALMRRALDETYIVGVHHNIAFLTALMANPRFLQGRLSTNFIPEEYPDGFSPAPIEKQDIDAIVAVSILMHLRYLYRAKDVTGQMHGYERKIVPDWVVSVNGTYYPIRVEQFVGRGSEEGFDVTREGHLLAIRSDWQVGEPVLRCTINAEPQRFKVERDGLGYRLFHMGADVKVMVYSERVAELAAMMPERKPPDMSQYLLSPMPGLLQSLAVEAGERVDTGDELAIVQAMKMENILRATRPGRVVKLHAEPGSTLSAGQIILEFEKAEKVES